jgi:sensor histidine kinase regulating citrate/malate metabolism
MDFLEKYLDLKSKDIKWAEITREITLIDEECSFTHNETILKNILNSIIENAYRHGFVGYECASPTIHFNVIEETEQIVMKICNNGKPINTTTEDYRTNGVFNGATGNTGIGGFQISRWANQYGGDVMVGKSDKWNTEIHLFIKK